MNHKLIIEQEIIISIEDDDARVVDKNLDNYLKELSNYPDIHLNDYPNDLFDNYPYFFDRLHDGDHANSLEYANIYLAYLYQFLNLDVANILYQNYLKTLQGEVGLICYWQKQWLKYVFNVHLAVELRQFNHADWVKIINQKLAINF